MKSAAILLIFFFVHTASLWSPREEFVGQYGDPLSHAAMTNVYCTEILPWKLHSTRFLAPSGVDLSTNFDSPFPMILTCPLVPMGADVQFHFYVMLQIALILLGGWLVASELFDSESWRLGYVCFSWWTCFYFVRSFEHITLFSGLWGFQFLLWCTLTVRFADWKNVVSRGAIIGLVLAGTFHNVAMLTLPILVCLGVSLWHQRRAARAPMLMRNTVIAAATGTFVFVALFAPAILAWITQELPKTPLERSKQNLDLVSLIAPWFTNEIYRIVPAPTMLGFEKFNSVDFLVWVGLAVTFTVRGFWADPLRLALAGLALVNLLIAFGPEFRFLDEPLAANPFEAIFKTFPFSLSRSPGRFATVFVLACTFLAFDGARARWQKAKWFRQAGWIVVIWAIVTGPVLYGRIVMPTLKLDFWMPWSALDDIKHSPPETIVTHFPAALMIDQGLNFFQIFHGHPMATGYLAYTSYTPETMRKFRESAPFVFATLCTGEPLKFERPPYGGDLLKYREAMLKANARYIIVNRNLMRAMPCPDLDQFVDALIRQPWVTVLEREKPFAVLRIN